MQSEKTMYNVLSPDGFPIHQTKQYSTIMEAENALFDWIKRFEKQGYYSYNFEKIPLQDLDRYCRIIKEEKN